MSELSPRLPRCPGLLGAVLGGAQRGSHWERLCCPLRQEWLPGGDAEARLCQPQFQLGIHSGGAVGTAQLCCQSSPQPMFPTCAHLPGALLDQALVPCLDTAPVFQRASWENKFQRLFIFSFLLFLQMKIPLISPRKPAHVGLFLPRFIFSSSSLRRLSHGCTGREGGMDSSGCKDTFSPYSTAGLGANRRAAMTAQPR